MADRKNMSILLYFIGNYQMNDLTLFDMIFKMTALCYRNGRGLNMTKSDRIYIETYKLAIINCPKTIFCFAIS